MIYFLQDDSNLRIKIGFTDGDPETRRKQLQVAAAGGLHLLTAIEGSKGDEADLHSRFGRFRRRGEWFDAAPPLMTFILDQVREQKRKAKERLADGEYPAALVALIEIEPGERYPRIYAVWEVGIVKPTLTTRMVGHVVDMDFHTAGELMQIFLAWGQSGEIAEGEDVDLRSFLGVPCRVNVVDGRVKRATIRPSLAISLPTVKPFARTSKDSTVIPGWVPESEGRPDGDSR